MANTGYDNLSNSQPPTARSAPPLGHVPPPPPSKPPPYAHFSSLPDYSSYNALYDKYAAAYSQPSTGNPVSPGKETVDQHEIHVPKGSLSAISPNKTTGEATGSTHTSTKDDTPFNDTNEADNLETKMNLTYDNRRDKVEDQSVSSSSEAVGKYKSDEGLKMKFSGGFSSKKRPNPSIAVQLKPQTVLKKKPKVDSSKISVAQAFGSDSDEGEMEEMPRAAKLRMRNIGKDTPTSAGPNSFNKTSKGFTDQAAVFKKQFGM